MEYLSIGPSLMQSSRLVYGCMRLVGDGEPRNREKGKRAIRTAIDAGYTQFDHADIYGAGECERLFGDVLQESPSLRDKMIITSKCGIRNAGTPSISSPKRYDFSTDYLLQSVDGSLARLGIESLDLLLLHRPDYLADMAEVANVFARLSDSGKVKYFGVSNCSPSQVTLLQSFCSSPLLVNQIEINIHNINALSDGTLDQCQQLRMTPQAWCPIGGVAYPAWGNTFSVGDERRIAKEIDLQAKKYDVESWIIALAWLLKHPAKICPIVGSTSSERIVMAKQALNLDYSRDDWYRLLEARNGVEVA